MDYLARCQYLLQEGMFVADFCFYTGGGAPWRMPEAAYPAGFDFDFFGTEALLQMTVVEGRLVLPSGMRYRMLVLPERRTLPVNALRKIVELAAAGAIIVGWNPERVAGLADAAAEAELLAIATKTAALPTVFISLDDAVAASELRPDFASDDASITFIHRSICEADVYYVASSNPQAHRAHCEFRVTGRLPEFWHPDSGQIEDVTDWEVREGRTRVAVPFDPVGSVFVVFRTPTTLRRSHPRSEPTVQEVSIEGPWQVAFQKGRGAPESIILPQLISWTDHPDAGVRYFSGEATCRCIFRHETVAGEGVRALIDLGALANLCEVRLNGIALGIRWKPPFCVDATAALKPGENMLEVDVVNLWPNRLIGDEQLKEDAEWKGPRLMEVPTWLLEGRPSPTGRVTFATWKNWKPNDPLLPSGLFGPVRLIFENNTQKNK